MRYCGRSRRWQRQYRRLHRLRRLSRCATRRAASAARHFGNEPTGAARPSLPAPQIPRLLRGESHLQRAIYGCVSSTLLPRPFAPGRPTDRVSAGHDQGLYFSNSTFPLAPPLVGRCTSYARAIIDLRRAPREMASVKCRDEVLINTLNDGERDSRWIEVWCRLLKEASFYG